MRDPVAARVVSPADLQDGESHMTKTREISTVIAWAALGQIALLSPAFAQETAAPATDAAPEGAGADAGLHIDPVDPEALARVIPDQRPYSPGASRTCSVSTS